MSIELYVFPPSPRAFKTMAVANHLGLEWTLHMLDLPKGEHMTPQYGALNPNLRMPTLKDGDYVLWESNSIMRYLNLAYGKASPIYPQDAKGRAAVDRWLDWTLSSLQPVDRPVFWGLVRTPPEQRDMAALQNAADAAAARAKWFGAAAGRWA